MSCQAFNNIPKNKLDIAYEDLEVKFKDPNLLRLAKDAILRFYNANIPVKYWTLDMEKFEGDPRLLEWYKKITEDLPGLYKKGISVCLAGLYGRGKTLTTTNILKQALVKGYSAQYVTLEDIITSTKSYDHYQARQELLQTHFLVIDELDPRYMATEAASDFQGRMLESVLRYRTQNKLPIFLCTNAVDIEQAFTGAIKEAISSLMNYVEIFPVLGKDYRKQEKI